jgi:hypothetical protein
MNMIWPWILLLNMNTAEYEYEYDMDIIETLQWATGSHLVADRACDSEWLRHVADPVAWRWHCYSLPLFTILPPSTWWLSRHVEPRPKHAIQLWIHRTMILLPHTLHRWSLAVQNSFLHGGGQESNNILGIHDNTTNMWQPPDQPPDDVATWNRMPDQPPGGSRWLTARSLIQYGSQHIHIYFDMLNHSFGCLGTSIGTDPVIRSQRHC